MLFTRVYFDTSLQKIKLPNVCRRVYKGRRKHCKRVSYSQKSPASWGVALLTKGRTKMLNLSKWCMSTMLAMAFAGTAVAQPVTATIRADQQTTAPITKLIFGGFMEPATTRVWAEKLGDRKFLNAINSKAQPAPTAGGLGRRGPQARWMPVGADEFVTMDSAKAYVGDWSPLVRLETSTPHGIRESGLQLRAGRAYSGRVVLAGSPGAKVDVSLIWGPDPADRQTVSVRIRTAGYAKYPLSFTSTADTTQGAFEIAATGSGSFHIGATSLMPADNVSGFRSDMIRMLKEQGIEIARWPGGN